MIARARARENAVSGSWSARDAESMQEREIAARVREDLAFARAINRIAPVRSGIDSRGMQIVIQIARPLLQTTPTD